MTEATLIMAVLAAALVGWGYLRRDGSHRRGLRMGMKLLYTMAPLLVAALMFAGLLESALDPVAVQEWLGSGSGWRGMLLGTMAGAVLPGGPYVTFPAIAAIYRAGASLGTMVALITAWALLGIGATAYEISFLGLRFSLTRLVLVLAFPPLAGLATAWLFPG